MTQSTRPHLSGGERGGRGLICTICWGFNHTTAWKPKASFLPSECQLRLLSEESAPRSTGGDRRVPPGGQVTFCQGQAMQPEAGAAWRGDPMTAIGDLTVPPGWGDHLQGADARRGAHIHPKMAPPLSGGHSKASQLGKEQICLSQPGQQRGVEGPGRRKIFSQGYHLTLIILLNKVGVGGWGAGGEPSKTELRNF